MSQLLIKERNKLHNLPVDEIIWIQSDGNYITLNTGKKKFIIKQSLRRILELLNDDRFVKIQKSFVIRTDLIDYINTQTDTVHIKSVELPIGRSFKEDFFKKYKILK